MIYVVIPARYESTRFPGKPLAQIAGKTMIQRVYEQAKKSTLVDKVIVATDDNKIFDHVSSFGGEVVLTSSEHQSGTDRIAEVIQKEDNADIIINVQGDEPIIPPEAIDLIAQPLLKEPEVQMSTLIRKCQSEEDFHNPNIVKAVIDKNNFALYFSRSCIPYIRNKDRISHYLHIGLYAYRRETLLQLCKIPPANLEQCEGLEQLRALYNGIKIKALITDYQPVSVDIPEDVAKVEDYIKKSRCLFGGL